MGSKEEIFAKIRASLKDVKEDDIESDTPVSWVYGQVEASIHEDDVIEVFVENVEDYGAEVKRVSSNEILSSAIDSLVEHGCESVLLPKVLNDRYGAQIEAEGIVVKVDEPQLNPYELDGIDAVFTASTVSVADTGTIILNHDDDQGRRALTLVPDVHICLVRDEQVVSGVPEAVNFLQESITKRMPLTWISGGSATSDIELNRVEGVHGPRTLIVLLSQ